MSMRSHMTSRLVYDIVAGAFRVDHEEQIDLNDIN